jgi:hypothetical protein
MGTCMGADGLVRLSSEIHLSFVSLCDLRQLEGALSVSQTCANLHFPFIHLFLRVRESVCSIYSPNFSFTVLEERE